MTLKESQLRIDEWISKYKIGYWKPLEVLARLIEEVGELARELNDRYGPKKKKDGKAKKEVGDELADIIFAIICLANSLGIDLDNSFNNMMEKIEKRDGNRWEKKDLNNNS